MFFCYLVFSSWEARSSLVDPLGYTLPYSVVITAPRSYRCLCPPLKWKEHVQSGELITCPRSESRSIRARITTGLSTLSLGLFPRLPGYLQRTEWRPVSTSWREIGFGSSTDPLNCLFISLFLSGHPAVGWVLGML